MMVLQLVQNGTGYRYQQSASEERDFSALGEQPTAVGEDLVFLVLNLASKVVRRSAAALGVGCAIATGGFENLVSRPIGGLVVDDVHRVDVVGHLADDIPDDPSSLYAGITTPTEWSRYIQFTLSWMSFSTALAFKSKLGSMQLIS
jgi:hypothetical protein